MASRGFIGSIYTITIIAGTVILAAGCAARKPLRGVVAGSHEEPDGIRQAATA